MPFTLIPAPATLDFEAPLLGRWFAAGPNPNDGPANVNVPAITAGGDLGVNVNLPNNTSWLPPALGSASLFWISGGVAPPQLAHLRNAAGQFPLPAGRVVAHFRLLPAVAERLYQLTRFLPAITGPAFTAANLGTYQGDPGPTRVKVAALTLVLPATIQQLNQLWPLIPDPPPFNDVAAADLPAAQARFLGLTVDSNGNLGNGPSPMSWLRRPGFFAPPAVLDNREDRILVGLSGLATLWAFDDRGRPIDPGAVAAWWSVLATTMMIGAGNAPVLVATGGTGQWPQQGGSPVVCQAAAGFSAHLVNAHEGLLGQPFLGGAQRLQDGSSPVSSNLLAGNAQVALGFSGYTNTSNDVQNPTVDDAPVPRLAVLPAGPYAAPAAGGGGAPIVTLWGGGNARAPGLARDFARVAVVDVERHLIGVPRRGSNPAPTSEADRRRLDQNRPTTRINVGAVTLPAPPAAQVVLLTTADDVAAAALGVLAATPAGATPARIVVPAADAQWGPGAPLPPAAALPPLPNTLTEAPPGNAALGQDQYRISAVAGDGATTAGGGVVNQMVVLELQLAPGTPPGSPSPFAGAWVRAWPLGFDLEAALHRRMMGGAGRVAADGSARLVMALPDDQTGDGARIGFDLTLSFTWQGAPVSRSFGDLRFARPASIGGAPQAARANAAIHVCEAGLTVPGGGALANGTVPPGATVVDEIPGGNPRFTLVDRTTLPPGALTGTLGNSMGGGMANIMLTQPAYAEVIDRLDRVGRGEVTTSTAPGTDPLGGLGALAPPAGPFVVDRVARNLLGAATRSSYPFQGCERLEVAATTEPNGTTLSGVIGSAPWLPRSQEQGAHHLGHPGAPATTDTCGTGAVIAGPAAIPLAEYTRERTSGLGMLPAGTPPEVAAVAVQSELAVAAVGATALPAPPAPASPTPLCAILRTVALGMEGLPGLELLIDEVNGYPTDKARTDAIAALDALPGGLNIGTTLNGAIGANNITRALDQRLRAKLRGARDAAFSLIDALGRAEDLVYIETPALDAESHGPTAGDQLNLWQTLLTRLGAAPSLRVVVCVPTRLPPGVPRGLREVRDALLLEAVDALRAQAPGRIAVFSPGAGGDRPLYLASTTVIIDDVYAVTGTTHLWRRGLSFDSSLACALFDERVTDGRCTEVVRFRTALMARRLGVPVATLPLDPADLLVAIRDLDQRGSLRLAAVPIKAPAPPAGAQGYPTATDRAVWDPDGSVDVADLDTLIAQALFTPPFSDEGPPP